MVSHLTPTALAVCTLECLYPCSLAAVAPLILLMTLAQPLTSLGPGRHSLTPAQLQAHDVLLFLCRTLPPDQSTAPPTQSLFYSSPEPSCAVP